MWEILTQTTPRVFSAAMQLGKFLGGNEVLIGISRWGAETGCRLGVFRGDGRTHVEALTTTS